MFLSKDCKFPILNHVESLRNQVNEKPEIRFSLQANGSTVCSYMISCENTFDDKYSRECRGIVFNATGEVIGRPLHKFFNVNEREETQVHNVDWSRVTRVMMKRDGSMIHTVKAGEGVAPMAHGANFTLKSKKSYESDVAVQARNWIIGELGKNHRWLGDGYRKIDPALGHVDYLGLCNLVSDRGMTAIFEWTSPTARIVVNYPEDALKLLHVRDNVTGYYLNEDELIDLAAQFGVPVVEPAFIGDEPIQENFSIQALLELAQVIEGIEGWVIQFDDGNMVKLKTKWYIDRHHAMTFLRERDIAKMALNETLDDLKSKLVGDGLDISEILEIEASVVAQVDEIIEEVKRVADAHRGQDRKSVALKLGSAGERHKFFGLIMQAYSGVEPNYTEFFERNYLSERFSLRQLKMVDSVAEVE